VYEWEQYAFRREQKGELSGLRRLRAFTMPDLHTMCKDLPQAAAEFKRQFLMDNQVQADIGYEGFIVIRTTEEFWTLKRSGSPTSSSRKASPPCLRSGPSDTIISS